MGRESTPKALYSQRKTQVPGCRAPHVLCGSFSMHFDPRLPFAVLLAALTFFHTSAEFHFCACRHELPAAPLCFRFSIENEVECCVLSNFILSPFSLLLLEHHLETFSPSTSF